jgi:hypothetical protein
MGSEHHLSYRAKYEALGPFPRSRINSPIGPNQTIPCGYAQLLKTWCFTAHGLEGIGGEGNTALFKGSSPWARYVLGTFHEMRPNLLQNGFYDRGIVCGV